MSENELDVGLVRRWFDKIEARNGIGQDLFLAISQLTPSVNVDLIIKSADETSTLLTWRDDEYYGPGWHVPGGVIRFKEKMIDRVHKVAITEFNRKLLHVKGPIGFHEMFNTTRDVRGHFVSFVFSVKLNEPPDSKLQVVSDPFHGGWHWFEKCPENLIPNQSALRRYF